MKIKIISNSLTKTLDERLPTLDELDQFIDDLEDEIFGISNRDFYLKFKGDIKELSDQSEEMISDLNFESELLSALIVYSDQRKKN